MNFLNITYFIAIAEERNISAAARKLYVSQQSLSEHLKKLEAEIGVPLFERGNIMQLTVAGECFLEGSKEILAAYNRMCSNIDAITENRRSKITIGVPTYMDPPFLGDLLARFTEHYPQYDVTVVKRQHADISHNMQGVDLYISYLPVPEELESTAVIENDPYCAVFHRELAQKTFGASWPSLEKKLLKTRDLSLLKDMPFILLCDRHGQLAADLDNIFKEYDFSPASGFTSENGHLNIRMCQKGFGCLLATRNTIKHCFRPEKETNDDFLFYPIDVTSFRTYQAICYTKGLHLHPAEICFINEARSFLSDSTKH